MHFYGRVATPHFICNNKRIVMLGRSRLYGFLEALTRGFCRMVEFITGSRIRATNEHQQNR